MKEISKIRAQIQVRDALNQRNGPSTTAIHDLVINSEVLIWRESKGWTGPFKLIGTQGETCIIQQARGSVQFRTTIVRSFYVVVTEKVTRLPIETTEK